MSLIPDLSHKLDGVRIMVAEDDKIMIKLLHSVLSNLGFRKIIVVADGQEAIKKIKEIPIDILICDWHMKPVDGMALTNYIRHDEESPNRRLPIIMLTGKADRRHVEQARDQGITEFIVKPFDVRELCDKIAFIVERPRKFVEAPGYIGPDRRRRKVEVPPELDRRSNK